MSECVSESRKERRGGWNVLGCNGDGGRWIAGVLRRDEGGKREEEREGQREKEKEKEKEKHRRIERQRNTEGQRENVCGMMEKEVESYLIGRGWERERERERERE